MTQTDKIAEKIAAFLTAQQGRGVAYVDLTANDVGELAGIPRKHELCVDAMEKAAERFHTEVLHPLRSRKAPGEIRFFLRNPAEKSR